MADVTFVKVALGLGARMETVRSVEPGLTFALLTRCARCLLRLPLTVLSAAILALWLGLGIASIHWSVAGVDRPLMRAGSGAERTPTRRTNTCSRCADVPLLALRRKSEWLAELSSRTGRRLIRAQESNDASGPQVGNWGKVEAHRELRADGKYA